MSDDLQHYYQQLHKQRRILQARSSRYSGDIPASVQRELDDYDFAIDLTDQLLAGQLSRTDWRAKLAILTVIQPQEHPGPYPIDLAEAQALLASLPLDHLPAPAPLPTGSRMPWSRNPIFVGREADLLALARRLKAGQTAAIGPIAAATGLGGIGKTSLAVEFVHRYGQFFAGGVFWLSFAQAEAVETEIADCGGPDHLQLWATDEGAPDLPTQVKLVQAHWQQPLPRLLIFDNCEDPNLLTRWQPPPAVVTSC
jgi:hypothetical protein